MTRYTEVLDRLLLEGEALVKAQRFQEGEERARQVLAQQPRNSGGHYVLALSALMQDRHAEALPHVESALRNDRVNPQYHFMAALCHAGVGKLDEAIASYRRALQYRPEFFEARANMGYLFECGGHIEEAAACYRQVLREQPDEWYSLNRLGYCERLLGRPEAAIAFFERSLEGQPRFAPSHNEIALSLLQLGRRAEAIAAFRRAIEVDPQFLPAWCNLGKVVYLDYVAAGKDADKAPVLACFECILQLDPGNEEFAYLRDCVAGVRRERPSDAYIATFFDRFAPQFDAKLTGELDYAGPRAAADFMAPWLAGRSGLMAVDLGCGTGLSGGFLRQSAARLVGVDLSAAMLERAQARAIYDELVQAEIGAFLEGQPEGSVDVAVALDVFIYVGDLARIFALAARALKPGGRFMFSVELMGQAGEGFAILPAGRYTHAPSYVEEVARAAGLQVAAATELGLRREANGPVPAMLFALDKPAP